MALTIEMLNMSGNIIIKLSGALGLESEIVRHYRQVLQGATQEGYHHVIIDLLHLDFIDTSAMGVLVGQLARHREKYPDGSFILIARDKIAHVLAITRLNELFPLFPTIEEACAHLQVEMGETKSISIMELSKRERSVPLTEGDTAGLPLKDRLTSFFDRNPYTVNTERQIAIRLGEKIEDVQRELEGLVKTQFVQKIEYPGANVYRFVPKRR